ncbi:MAG: cytochrome c biogenesis protein ResB [Burkholderiales bacterium]|nr:cytochrome c biogenesis protein ResB [Burkholderiales bacterium]
MDTLDTSHPSSTATTQGMLLTNRGRFVTELVELVSSMRFAISLLTIISIASVVGTVVIQGEPMPNYVNQFGPFWFEVFARFSVYSVYSAWWFLLIMAFLVTSTSLCIIRNAPKMIADMKSWRVNVREQSLRNFHHHAEWSSSRAIEQLASEYIKQIAAAGYQVRQVPKDGAVLLSAKQGAANKLGYIFAHSAIVIICVGGLLDSNLPIRAQQWMFGKETFKGSGVIADIPEKHRLGNGNITFRGNTLIPEGQSSNTTILQMGDGVLIQDLPFSIQLEQFIVDFYSTGMPKLFASNVIVTDKETGNNFRATIKVNEPLIYKGLAVYQSSFEDGGSSLKLAGYPMAGSSHVQFPVDGQVGKASRLAGNDGDYTIEWSGFRPFNVENMAGDPRSVKQPKGFNENLEKRLGSAANRERGKDLRNVGPSVQYKLRDKTGQAREFSNYMMPVNIDGEEVFLAGVRDNPSEGFRYLRIPADANGKVDEWMRLRAAISDPALREKAAKRYGANVPLGANSSPQMREQLQLSALRGLNVFAGDAESSGYIAVARFIDKVPKEQQERTVDIFMKILNGAMWELWQVARDKDGLPAAVPDAKSARFLQRSTDALADSFFYGAPVYLQLRGFDEVKASVFQVTRSPGKNVVYLGCLLLVLGVFSMLYIRERRLWVWLRPDADGGVRTLMAMSTQRRSLDFDKEFEQMKARLPST